MYNKLKTMAKIKKIIEVEEPKTPKTYKLTEGLIERIDKAAKKADRSPHYMVIQVLEKSFK